MTSRHGLITGVTGSGKTVTLQVIIENLSRSGVPTFVADIKGDLSGISQIAEKSPKLTERAKMLGLSKLYLQSCPVRFWDVYGEHGHPVQTTIRDMGADVMAKLLDLTQVQGATLMQVFKIAEDNDFILRNLPDLYETLGYILDHAKEFESCYGRIAKTSIAAIQRALIGIEDEGGDALFGAPKLELADLIIDNIVNILDATKLMKTPRVYAALLIWLLTEVYESMPEVGDLKQPKFVMFFDEAHLLFSGTSKVLVNKIEQIIRLIRSKGVGIYFVTQTPGDVPESVLGQLNNRVQHALRAYTPKDQKAVRVAAQTLRQNPKLNTEKVISELRVGEALVSFLDETGAPQVVERAWILPPRSRIGAIADVERQQIIDASPIGDKYTERWDLVGAYEKIKELRMYEPVEDQRRQENILDTFLKSAAKSIGSSFGKKFRRIF